MRKTLLALICTAALAGCDFVTDPDPLQEFAFQQLEPGDYEESVDVAGFPGEILAVGQFAAPSACYTIEGNFSRSGSTITLRATAVRRNSSNCNATETWYRWSAAIRDIGRNTYDMRIIHDFRNDERPESVHTVQVTGG